MLLTTLLVKVISSLTQLIVAGGVADAEGTLAIGDVIISINGTTVKDILHKKLLELLTGKSTINLVIQRDSKTLMSSRSSICHDEGPLDTARPKKVPPPVAPKNFTLTPGGSHVPIKNKKRWSLFSSLKFNSTSKVRINDADGERGADTENIQSEA